MFLINFSDSSKKAFVKGFWKGMAAPVMIFGKFEIPETQKIEQEPLQLDSTEEALSKDWQAIGDDIYHVIVEYEQKASSSK